MTTTKDPQPRKRALRAQIMWAIWTEYGPLDGYVRRFKRDFLWKPRAMKVIRVRITPLNRSPRESAGRENDGDPGSEKS